MTLDYSMCVVPSSLHQKVKFSIIHGIVELRGDQSMAGRCQIAIVGHKQEDGPGTIDPL